jgi:hypothetical protein
MNQETKLIALTTVRRLLAAFSAPRRHRLHPHRRRLSRQADPAEVFRSQAAARTRLRARSPGMRGWASKSSSTTSRVPARSSAPTPSRERTDGYTMSSRPSRRGQSPQPAALRRTRPLRRSADRGTNILSCVRTAYKTVKDIVDAARQARHAHLASQGNGTSAWPAKC